MEGLRECVMLCMNLIKRTITINYGRAPPGATPLICSGCDYKSLGKAKSKPPGPSLKMFL